MGRRHSRKANLRNQNMRGIPVERRKQLNGLPMVPMPKIQSVFQWVHSGSIKQNRSGPQFDYMYNLSKADLKRLRKEQLLHRNLLFPAAKEIVNQKDDEDSLQRVELPMSSGSKDDGMRLLLEDAQSNYEFKQNISDAEEEEGEKELGEGEEEEDSGKESMEVRQADESSKAVDSQASREGLGDPESRGKSQSQETFEEVEEEEEEEEEKNFEISVKEIIEQIEKDDKDSRKMELPIDSDDGTLFMK